MGDQCDRCGAPVMVNPQGRTVHVELADIFFCALILTPRIPIGRATQDGDER